MGWWVRGGVSGDSMLWTFYLVKQFIGCVSTICNRFCKCQCFQSDKKEWRSREVPVSRYGRHVAAVQTTSYVEFGAPWKSNLYPTMLNKYSRFRDSDTVPEATEYYQKLSAKTSEVASPVQFLSDSDQTEDTRFGTSILKNTCS